MTKRLPIVEAWLANKPDEVLRIAVATAPDDPLAPAYEVMRLCFEIDTGKRPATSLKDACDRALRDPIPDACVLQFVLRAAIFDSVYQNHLADAENFLCRAQDNADHADDPIVSRSIYQLTYVVARARDDYPGQLKALNEGLADRETDIISATSYRVWHFQAAYENHDLPTAQSDLKAIGSRRDILAERSIMAYSLFEVVMLQLRGEHRAALQRHSEMSEQEIATAQSLARYFQAVSLIQLHLMDAAAEIIEKMSEQADKSPSSSYSRYSESQAIVQYLRAEHALGRGDTETAWSLADQLADTALTEHPRWKKQAKHLLIEAALAQRNITLASRLLAAIDPEQNRSAFRMLWIRLRWQKEEREYAARAFARLRHDTREHPGYIPAQLRFASEFSAADTARLYRLAEQSDELGLPGNRYETVKKYAHATLTRRERILTAFRTHRRLTRAQVIALVGCAPNTASKDLATLQAQGHIERHNTSEHARTAYFTYLSNSSLKQQAPGRRTE